MALKWYAARTRPQAEYLARDRLETDGLEVFLPCVRTPRPRPGHGDVPLFPGYLFLQCDPEEHSLPRLPQLMNLVRFDGEVASVPDDVIHDLDLRVKAISGSGGLWNRFRDGERVRIAVGPSESLAEVVEGANSPEGRVRVALSFMGRRVETEVPWRDVQPVGLSGVVPIYQDGRPEEQARHGGSVRRTRGKGRRIKGRGPRANEGTGDTAGPSNNGHPSS